MEDGRYTKIYSDGSYIKEIDMGRILYCLIKGEMKKKKLLAQ